MQLHLDSQVVLVAGSSRGIGKETARAFLTEGCRTVITGRDPGSLHHAIAEFELEFGSGQVMACKGDLTQQGVIEKTLARIHERWGNLDCLIANVGSGRGKVGWDLSEADWLNLFNLNLSSSVRLITEVLPEMIKDKHGSIVVVSSIVGKESTSAPLPYSAAKAALINYTKNLSRQVGQFNIRVNCVAPGNILFPGGSWEKHLSEHREELMYLINTEVPLQRFGRPEEIADLIVFLSSDRSSFITGACIVADGGQTKGV